MANPRDLSVPQGAVNVTPSDSDDLPDVCRALYIGTAGALHVTYASGSEVTFPNVQAGQFPGAFRRVHATGTTATDISALF